MSEPRELGMTPDPGSPPIIWIPYDISDEPEIVGRTADGRPIFRDPEGPTMLDRVREHLERVAKILDNAGETAHAKLSSIAMPAASGRAVDAYELMANSCRMEGLGPAFGTKFIYFVDSRGLILDRLVARSLAEVSSIRVDPTRWNGSTYAEYLAAVSAWAGELQVDADVLEQIMFTTQSKALGNQWA